MAKIYVIASNHNHVNWENTGRVIMSYPDTFADGQMDFGIGPEPYFTCPGCSRNLPVVIFHLDYIKSQARHTVSNMGVIGADRFVIINHGLDRAVGASAAATGGYVTITSGSKYYPTTAYINTAAIWQNDLRNLQFLCSSCNSSKRDLDWETWGRADFETRPLSRIWKNQGGG